MSLCSLCFLQVATYLFFSFSSFWTLSFVLEVSLRYLRIPSCSIVIKNGSLKSSVEVLWLAWEAWWLRSRCRVTRLFCLRELPANISISQSLFLVGSDFQRRTFITPPWVYKAAHFLKAMLGGMLVVVSTFSMYTYFTSSSSFQYRVNISNCS